MKQDWLPNYNVPPDFAAMSAEYDAWLADTGYEPMCAEDMLYNPELTQKQGAWLRDFITRWDVMMDAHVYVTPNSYERIAA